ncbi:very long chain fatty acid elongase 1-like [Chironomus tepperi]|uniref:very long chain fatty acid elongase 1-like n=1 Tax=Chironomus tepperi TaxID=113505 RepID=UPI00391F8217
MRLDTGTVPSNSTSFYHELFYERADPRIRDKFLMGNPLPIVSIYAFYIIFIKYLLPRYMRDRKPIDIEKLGIALTIVLFFNSLYFTVIGSEPWLFIYNWRCEPVDMGYSELALKFHDNIACLQRHLSSELKNQYQ